MIMVCCTLSGTFVESHIQLQHEDPCVWSIVAHFITLGSSSVPMSFIFLRSTPFHGWVSFVLCSFLSMMTLGFQWPSFPHPLHVSSFTRHGHLPGGCDLLQCPQECWSSLAGFLTSLGHFWFCMASTGLEVPRPIATRLSEITIWMQHISSIVDILASTSKVVSLLVLYYLGLWQSVLGILFFLILCLNIVLISKGIETSKSSSGDSPGGIWTSWSL